MQLLFLSITECFTAQTGWSLRCCIQLTWADLGSGEVLWGGTCECGTSQIPLKLLWQRCLLLAQFNGEELEGAHTYLSEAHIYLPAVFPFEKELCGAVNPSRICLRSAVLLDWPCQKWVRWFCPHNTIGGAMVMTMPTKGLGLDVKVFALHWETPLRASLSPAYFTEANSPNWNLEDFRKQEYWLNPLGICRADQRGLLQTAACLAESPPQTVLPQWSVISRAHFKDFHFPGHFFERELRGRWGGNYLQQGIAAFSSFFPPCYWMHFTNSWLSFVASRGSCKW